MITNLPIKNEFGASILELSRLARTERITASRLVTSRPCWLLFVSFCPKDATAVATGSIENSETTVVNTLIDAETQYGQCKVQPGVPIYFNRGLYVSIGVNLRSVTVQYIEDSL